jgi:hypothetical protein
MNSPSAVLAILNNLFHRLEARFDCSPTQLALDEAWIYVDHPTFAARLRELLKELCKLNVANERRAEHACVADDLDFQARAILECRHQRNETVERSYVAGTGISVRWRTYALCWLPYRLLRGEPD